MKKIKILGFALIAFLGFNACEEDDNFTIDGNQTDTAVINLPQNQESFVLDIANPQATAATVVWDGAAYSVPTAVTYTVQLALSGTDFANPIDAGTTTETFLVWTNEELNGVSVDGLGLVPFSAGDVDLRIKSAIGSEGAEEAFSEAVTVSITPYTTSLPRFAVPGNHQGWNPDINEPGIEFVPYIASSEFGATDYEGYVWLDGEYKFVEPNDSGEFVWGNTDWGDDGSFSGVMVSEGEINFPAAAPGYYFIRANTDPEDSDSATYSVDAVMWAITGDATPLGWPDNGVQDQDMTYNSTTGKWEITINLSDAGAFKFRANDAWDINYGDEGADGILDFNNGNNMTVSTSGTYFVELDLSNPREYTYTATLQ
ncbi:SusE domain-containing protein [uncultured Psychroserpens sp.]|uniref:SusE domain-containing protein n=1 Tax=uncultured Psychroserpens sp. TaxID=255436 RepID=UPI0026035D45|nr:SusE domain-containing protein [uncultured Psychroserpens sp.]